MAGIQTKAEFTTVQPGELRIITSDIEARPMSFVDDDTRLGFEPALARAICDRLNVTPAWFDMPLEEFYPKLTTGEYDVVLFNQAITQERRAWADFTRSYGRFDSAVLVREDSEIEHKLQLASKRIGVFAESVSQQLLERFPPDIEVVFFEGKPEVASEMVQALREGDIDAIVEDSLLLMAAEAQDPGVRVAFEIPTQYPFGIGVLPGNRELLEALNSVLSTLIMDGTLKKLWGQWIPYKPYPF